MTTRRQAEAAVVEEDLKYRTALGEFVMAWADTEAELYRVLTNYAGLSDHVARAILSGSRASTMVNYIRAIMHNDVEMAEDRKKDLEFVLPQIVTINTIRDRIVHYSSAKLIAWKTSDPTTRYIDNRARVSRYGKHDVNQVGSKMLRDIIQDLYEIQNHLSPHTRHLALPFVSFGRDKRAKKTWRYKPAQPKHANPKRARDPRKQRPQR